MRKRTSRLEDWEIALVRAMIRSGRFEKKQDILPYFNRPGRSINQARISQIASGRIAPSVAPASEAQLNAFLATWHDPVEARRSFISEDPCGDAAINLVLRVSTRAPRKLDLEESDVLELKESFNWASRAEYARTMAGFANNGGGYIVFGINDRTKDIVGLNGDSFKSRDVSTITQFLNEHFAPHIRYVKKSIIFLEHAIGVIYVWPSDSKPVICVKTTEPIRDGDIYFRYVGETRRIKAADLQRLIDDRLREHERRLRQAVIRLVEVGAENAAIMDITRGTISGPAGSFLIDASLVPKLRVIREGTFDEVNGAPALKLVGNLMPIGTVERVKVERQPLTDADILRAFIEQQDVSNPMSYVRALAMLPHKWMPVYFFLARANAKVNEGITALSAVEKAYAVRVALHVKRLRDRIRPDLPTGAIGRSVVTALATKQPIEIRDALSAKEVLCGIRRLRADEIDFSYLQSLMMECFRYYRQGSGKHNLDGELRAAAAFIDDSVWGEQVHDQTEKLNFL